MLRKKKKFTITSSVGMFRRLRYNNSDMFVGYVALNSQGVSARLVQVRGKLNVYQLLVTIPCENTYTSADKLTNIEREAALDKIVGPADIKPLEANKSAEEFFTKGEPDVDFDDMLNG